MNLNDISTQLLYTTVPIWVQRADGRQSFGTAFYYAVAIPDQPGRQVPFIVTNFHVVDGATRAVFELVERSGDAPKGGARVRVEMPGDAIVRHSNSSIDIAAIPVGGVLSGLEQTGKPVFFRSIGPEIIPSEAALAELSAIEDVTFIGYPSGLYDEHNATPLVRRGITATPPWNNFRGQDAFLVDAGVFPGSSGSPVFILNQGAYATKDGISLGNRLLFMGVLSEAILRAEPNVPNVYLGLGKVVKSAAIRDFLHPLAAKLAKG